VKKFQKSLKVKGKKEVEGLKMSFRTAIKIIGQKTGKMTILCTLFILFYPGLSGITPSVDRIDRDDELPLLLEKITERIRSYPQLVNWKASVITVQTEVDKNWKPKKILRIHKTVSFNEEKRQETILLVEESEKGETRDITQKYLRELEENRRRAEKQEDQRRQQEQRRQGESQRRRPFNLEDFLPFSEKNRPNYTFSRLNDEILEGKPVIVLESRAKTKSDQLWEGKYFISQESHDLIKVVLKPAKNPKIVRELLIEATFDVLPSGHFVVRKTKMKVDAGMFLKNVRMIIEEDYTDYSVDA
jgi:hypothetical protein